MRQIPADPAMPDASTRKITFYRIKSLLAIRSIKKIHDHPLKNVDQQPFPLY